MTSPDEETFDEWLHAANQDLTNSVTAALDIEAVLDQVKRQAMNTVGALAGMGFDVLKPTQVTVDAGLAPIDDPPVRALSPQPAARPACASTIRRPPLQLPRDISHFVGRVDILRQLDDLLATPNDQPAIVSLDGAPGVGKTALAIHWARNSRTHFDDGVLYADLNGYGPGAPTSPATVLATFLDVLGIPPDQMPRDLGERASLLRRELTGKRILVVLDNARDSAHVRPLLAATSPSLVVITSRQQLAVLAYRDGAHCITIPALLPDEAITLLQLRIGHARVVNDLPAIYDLAALCSHTPLALRIAGEHVAARPDVPVSELVQYLCSQHRLLDAGAHGDDESVTLRAVFDWSTNTLPRDVDHLFCLLSLHPSTQMSTRAATALTGWPLERTERAFDMLVGANLARQHGPDSYRLHDLIHLYAGDRARRRFTREECREAVHRQVDWYLATAGAAVSKVSPQRRPVPPLALETSVQPQTFDSSEEALRWCIRERPQLLAVARMAVQYQFHDHVWRLITTFDDIFNRFGDPLDTVEIYRAALDSARISGSRFGEEFIHNNIGVITFYLGQYENAARSYTQALAIARETNDQIGESACIFNIGTTLVERGSYHEAIECYRQSLTIVERLDDKDGQARVYHRLGEVYQHWEQPGEAEGFFQRALLMRIERNDLRGQAATLTKLGDLSVENDPVKAIEYCEKSLKISRDVCGNGRAAAEALAIRGTAQYRSSMHTEAVASAQEAASLCHALRDARGEARALKILAQAQEAMGDSTAADRARVEALALVEGSHDPTTIQIRTALSASMRPARDAPDQHAKSRSRPGEPPLEVHDTRASSAPRSPSLLYAPARRRRRRRPPRGQRRAFAG